MKLVKISVNRALVYKPQTNKLPDTTYAFSDQPPLFIAAVKDICTINNFEELLNILFSQVNCQHFGFKMRLLITTTNDLSLSLYIYKLFHRCPLVLRFFFLPLLVARDVVSLAHG